MDKISDVQYVKNYDEQIGALYEEAKASYIDAPIQTLVSLRSVVHEICKQLHREYFLKSDDDLYSMINALRLEKVVNRNVIDFMYAIKRPGDKAAHKHQYEITMDQYRDMSVDSVQKFCQLIEAINSALHNDFSAYVFEEKVASFLEKLSYKAIFENDPEAKFKVGTALIEQVITTWNDSKSSGLSMISDDGKFDRGIKLIIEAADEQYPDAMYEYGFMLSKGYHVNKDIKKALAYLWTAANLDHHEAKAYFGCIVIGENITEEIPFAIGRLKESAEESNPLALTLLSTLYAAGEHVEFDVDKSNQLLEQAVCQDYPAALWLLAIVKLEVNEDELSIELFEKSKGLGHWRASLNLARFYASKTQEYHQQAKSEYRYFIESCDVRDLHDLEYLKIKFEYAQFKFSLDGDGLQSFVDYSALLVGIYQDEECSEILTTSIEKITPPLMNKYYPLMISDKSFNEKALLTHFRPNGKPYKTEAEVFDNWKKIEKNPSLAISKVYGVHPSHIKRQAQIEKEEALKQQAQIEQKVALKQQNQIAKERKQQASIKRQKDKAKTRKANKLKGKHKR